MSIRSTRRSAFVAALLVSAACGVAVAAYSPGQSVEVREGDSWSPATFLKQEGRKFQIKYADGTEEWVAADRLRAPAAAAGGVTPPVTKTPGTGTPVTLDGPFTVIALQESNNKAPKRAAGNISVIVPPATKPSQSFTDLTPNGDTGLGDVQRLIQCVDKPGTFVATGRVAFKDEATLLCIDVNNPAATEARVLPAKHEVLAAADGGRILISRPQDFSALTLHQWEWDGQAYQLKANYTFGSNGDRDSNKAPREAVLVTPRTLLIQSGFDETYLIDLPTRRQLASAKISDLKIHPSGRYFVGRFGSDAALIRPNDLAIVAMVPNVNGSFTLDPTANYAAYNDGGGISVIRLNSKHVVGKLAGVSASRGDIELINENTLLVGDIYYDLKTGVPVWKYADERCKRALLPSGQVLWVGSTDRQSLAVMGEVPEKNATSAKTALSPDKFAITPGASIAITGDLGAFGDAAKAKQNVEKSLTNAGHKSDDTAAQYKLNFVSAAGPTEKWQTRVYQMGGPPFLREISAPSTLVTATLTRDGQTIWSREMKFGAGAIINRKANQSLEDAAAEAARPNPGTLLSLGIPGYLVAGGDGKGVRTLGESKVSRSGLGGE
ncbi:MAG: tudor domain-containing protein [Tepidisphaeraceae bacterium]